MFQSQPHRLEPSLVLGAPIHGISTVPGRAAWWLTQMHAGLQSSQHASLCWKPTWPRSNLRSPEDNKNACFFIHSLTHWHNLSQIILACTDSKMIGRNSLGSLPEKSLSQHCCLRPFSWRCIGLNRRHCARQAGASTTEQWTFSTTHHSLIFTWTQATFLLPSLSFHSVQSSRLHLYIIFRPSHSRETWRKELPSECKAHTSSVLRCYTNKAVHIEVTLEAETGIKPPNRLCLKQNTALEYQVSSGNTCSLPTRKTCRKGTIYLTCAAMQQSPMSY